MSNKVTCYCLFDITQTNILNRTRPPLDHLLDEWIQKRNTQANFDTIIQVISLRSQPEYISQPEKIFIRFDEFEHFGFLYRQIEEEVYPCWKFNFEISHTNVFEDGIIKFGHLYADCDGVPMLKCGTEWKMLSSFLDATPELKNIHFEDNHGK